MGEKTTHELYLLIALFNLYVEDPVVVQRKLLEKGDKVTMLT
jgi:hypothetical protein